jgi:alkylation response protein AidB-like acyl-CoA dehydrogenase
MDLEPTDEQNTLRDELRRFVSARVDHDARWAAAAQPGAVDRDLWRELGSMGVFGLLVAEDAGGVGLGWAEAAIVFEELGRAAVPGPTIATALAATIDGLGVAGLPSDRVVDGTAVVGLVEASDPLFVEHLDGLDALLVLDGGSVTLADPPSGGAPVDHPLDPLTPLTMLGSVPTGRAVEGDGVAHQLRAGSALLGAAFQVGLGTAALELGTEYAKDREQFGRVIGSFQAVKHILADAAVGLEVARAAVHAAAVARDEGAEGHRIETARIVASRAAHTATEACIQVHGGMGYTWELDAHLFLKRVLVLDQGPATVHDAVDAVAASL